jgi:hypothetical protein
VQEWKPVQAAGTPREVVEGLEQRAGRPVAQRGAERERFTGYGVMGLPFESGHVLGLRRFPLSSIGPGYTSIWHRSPDGRWGFWSTVSPALSCARYTGEISDDSREAPLQVAWPEPYRLTIASDDPRLSWDVTFAATRATRALSALSRRLPHRFLARESVLRGIGPVAGTILGAGRLSLTGRMPNRQTFHLVPTHVGVATASRAHVDGTDLGNPAPLAEQATIGDFRIPQRGLLAVGALDFDPQDPSRHSTRTTRA